MKVDKEIISKIEQTFYFISGKVKLDATYFMSKIEEGLKESDLHYKTNIQGWMTKYNFFNSDPHFHNVLHQILNSVDKYQDTKQYQLDTAWGYKEDKNSYTILHDHVPSYLSGVIYLNKHKQKLLFPEIHQAVNPEEGRFVIFSSFLKHEAKRNPIIIPKYGISFNLKYYNSGDAIF